MYGGNEDEWVTFGSGRMIMGSDSQLPMTGGSEYITESQLPSHSHPYLNGYQTTYGASGTTAFSTVFEQTSTTGSAGSGQAYYPPYIQTYMWRKVLTSTTIIYSAAGDAMGTVFDLLDLLYPIGSVVARSSEVTTSYLFSEAQSQTWVQFAQGRTLVGQDPSDTAFDGPTPTAYVGEKEHTLTKAEMPPHTHEYLDYHQGGGAGLEAGPWHQRYDVNTIRSTGDGSADGLQGLAHNNVQPYEVVYYYKRTA